MTPLPLDSTALALWCLLGKDQVLTLRSHVPALDRSALLLPRLAPGGTPAQDRDAIESFLTGVGLNPTRQPITALGAPIAQVHGQFQKIKLYAIALPASTEHLPEPCALLSISKTTAWTDDGAAEHVDALLDCATHRYFALAGTGSRPMDSEIFASLPVHALRGDYLNFWFPDAMREFEPLGLLIEIDALEPHQPILRISGRAPLTPDELDAVRSRLVDLGRHARGRFWVTEILDGHEALVDYADPANASKVASGALS